MCTHADILVYVSPFLYEGSRVTRGHVPIFIYLSHDYPLGAPCIVIAARCLFRPCVPNVVLCESRLHHLRKEINTVRGSRGLRDVAPVCRFATREHRLLVSNQGTKVYPLRMSASAQRQAAE